MTPSRVLTAYHCVAGFGRPRVIVDDERVATVVVAVDRGRDLALLERSEGAWSEATWPVAGPPDVGAALTAYGHPYGARDPGGFFEGTLRDVQVPVTVVAAGRRALQLSHGLGPGMSGGPVVDANGEIVGVVSRRLGSFAFAGRADPLPTDGGSPLGGSVTMGLGGRSGLDLGARPTLGLRAEVDLRDRAFVTGDLGLAVPWRDGEQRWIPASVAGGLRHAFGHRPGTISVDVHAGVAAVTQGDEGAVPQRQVVPFGGVGLRTGPLRTEVRLDAEERVDVALWWRLPWPAAVY